MIFILLIDALKLFLIKRFIVNLKNEPITFYKMLSAYSVTKIINLIHQTLTLYNSITPVTKRSEQGFVNQKKELSLYFA